MGLALLFAGAVACDDEEYQTEYMRTKAAFLEAIEGKISALQWWRTAVTLHVNVKNVTSALVSAYSVGEGVPGKSSLEVLPSSLQTLQSGL